LQMVELIFLQQTWYHTSICGIQHMCALLAGSKYFQFYTIFGRHKIFILNWMQFFRSSKIVYNFTSSTPANSAHSYTPSL
jgi:hypothetical protein